MTSSLRRLLRSSATLALEICGRCGGTGVVQGKLCPVCGGTGARRP